MPRDISVCATSIACGCIAAAIVIVLIAWQAAVPGTAPALPMSHLIYHGPTTTTGIMVTLVPLIATWAILATRRCSNERINRWILAIAAMLVFWLIIARVKWSSRNDLVTSLLWYLYYPPMLLSSSFMLFMGLELARAGFHEHARKAMRLVIAIDTVLLALVLTNNLHHLAFAFDFQNPNWSGEYAYGPVYWTVFVWMIVQFAAFCLAIFASARRSLRHAVIAIAALGIICLVFCLCYILRAETFFTKNITLFFVTLIIVTVEACLDLKILPSYPSRQMLQATVPFDLQILSNTGEIRFSTAKASPLDGQTCLQAVRILSARNRDDTSEIDSNRSAEEARAAMPAAFRDHATADVLHTVYPINGGIAVLTEDISSLNRQLEYLEERRRLLKRQNGLLCRNLPTDTRKEALLHERELFDEVEQSLLDAVNTILALLDDLPPETSECHEERMRTLMRVKLLVAYCKRKGGLTVEKSSGTVFDAERIRLVMNEASVDLRASGIDCAALVEMDEPMPASTLSILYDCLYDFATVAFSLNDPTLMMYLHKHGTAAELRIILHYDDSTIASDSATILSLEEKLAARDATYRIDHDDGELCLVVRASLAWGALS